MKHTFTKIELNRFLNEMTTRSRYRKVTEEPLKKGYFSSRDISIKYDIVQRIVQRKLNALLEKGRLDVVMARRRVSPIVIRNVPCYKFKFKSDEKSFKSHAKRK